MTHVSVDLHIASLKALRHADEISAACLDPGERARAERLLEGVVQDRFVFGRSFLRHLLGNSAGWDPGEVPIHAGPNGRPETRGPHDFPFFSISHSGDLIAIALLEENHLGVDIEVAGPRGDPTALARRWFAPREARAVESAPEPEREEVFRRVWCRKEAALKAVGTGLMGGLADLVVGDEPGGRGGVQVRFAGREIYLFDFPADLGIAGSIAVVGPGARLDSDRIFLRLD